MNEKIIHYVAKPTMAPYLPYMLCRGHKHHRGEYDMYATTDVKKVTCEDCRVELRKRGFLKEAADERPKE